MFTPHLLYPLCALFLTSSLLSGSPRNPLNPDNLPQDILDEPIPETLAELTLIGPGVAAPVIVIGRKANEMEAYAAEEMASHLSAITSQPIKIYTEDEAPEGSVRIVIGRTEKSRSLVTDKTGPEQYVREVTPKGMTIVGGSAPPIRSKEGHTYLQERGTLYGVYDFLEMLGVRWYRPEEWGTYLPKRKIISLPLGMHRSPPPAFRGRSALKLFPSENKELALKWNARQRLNYYSPYRSFGPQERPQNRFGDRLRVGLGHGHNHVIPPETYLQSHPEYFALVNGKRGDPGSGRVPQLCLGNPALQDEFARRVIEFARANPEVECIGIDPEDGTQLGLRMCVCELCVAMDDPVHPDWMSNRIFTFSNIIAKRLAEAVPGAKVGLFAYSSHTRPPTRVSQLEPNLMIAIANINAWSDHSKPLTAPDNQPNANLLQLIKEWSEIATHPLWMREYSSYGWKGPFPSYRLLKTRISGYRDLGIEGFVWPGEPDRATQMLLLYFKAQLQWNPDLAVERELEAFYQNYYGPAAEPMKAYHERWMNALENFQLPASLRRRNGAAFAGIYSGGRGLHMLCTPALLNALAEDLARAVKLAGSDPLYSRRLAGDLATHEYCTKVAQMLKDKLENGVLTPYSNTDVLEYLASPKSESLWADFLAWLNNYSKSQDLFFNVWSGEDGALRGDPKPLGYMKRDILLNARYRGWDEPALLKNLGFDQPLTPTPTQP